MQLTAEQFEQIADLLPRQRGNVSLDSLRLINAILYVAANGCKWRARPKHHGNWHTIWSRSGARSYLRAVAAHIGLPRMRAMPSPGARRQVKLAMRQRVGNGLKRLAPSWACGVVDG